MSVYTVLENFGGEPSKLSPRPRSKPVGRSSQPPCASRGAPRGNVFHHLSKTEDMVKMTKDFLDIAGELDAERRHRMVEGGPRSNPIPTAMAKGFVDRMNAVVGHVWITEATVTTVQNVGKKFLDKHADATCIPMVWGQCSKSEGLEALSQTTLKAVFPGEFDYPAGDDAESATLINLGVLAGELDFIAVPGENVPLATKEGTHGCFGPTTRGGHVHCQETTGAELKGVERAMACIQVAFNAAVTGMELQAVAMSNAAARVLLGATSQGGKDVSAKPSPLGGFDGPWCADANLVRHGLRREVYILYHLSQEWIFKNDVFLTSTVERMHRVMAICGMLDVDARTQAAVERLQIAATQGRFTGHPFMHRLLRDLVEALRSDGMVDHELVRQIRAVREAEKEAKMHLEMFHRQGMPAGRGEAAGGSAAAGGASVGGQQGTGDAVALQRCVDDAEANLKKLNDRAATMLIQLSKTDICRTRITRGLRATDLLELPAAELLEQVWDNARNDCCIDLEDFDDVAGCQKALVEGLATAAATKLCDALELAARMQDSKTKTASDYARARSAITDIKKRAKRS